MKRSVALDAEQEGIFQHRGQQQGRRLGAIHRTLEPGTDQPGQPADVIDMHMGENERPDGAQRKLDAQVPGAPAPAGGFITLKQSAVYKNARFRRQMQLVA